MKTIDLSHFIYTDMPVYPGVEPVKIQEVSTLSKDGFKECKICIHSHNGTHVDVSGHMLKRGKSIDNIHTDSFIGKGTILDFHNHHSQLIRLEDILIYKGKIEKSDFIIIKTGWSKYWETSLYFSNYPCLNSESASWLSNFSIKGLGIDAISVDSPNSAGFLIHKILLVKNIIIIENLTNLEMIDNEYFLFTALPLKIKGADGSPVRAIAII